MVGQGGDDSCANRKKRNACTAVKFFALTFILANTSSHHQSYTSVRNELSATVSAVEEKEREREKKHTHIERLFIVVYVFMIIIIISRNWLFGIQEWSITLIHPFDASSWKTKQNVISSVELFFLPSQSTINERKETAAAEISPPGSIDRRLVIHAGMIR